MTTLDSLSITRQAEREVVITRSFRAPRTLVFRAYTDPRLIVRWMGPAAWSFDSCEVDLREGGRYRYAHRGPDGETLILTGEFRRIVEPDLLVTTENFSDEWNGGESELTTTFVEADGLTTVTTTVTYASPEAREGALASRMEHGLSEGYRRLDQLLATGGTAS